ncbi:ABC transporter permease [Sphingomonas sanxanigenens]|uniref:ABC-2 type transporter transmembrane domain-containing protein n=1 Tax=Sphingomonas sanxanigenens DSM 19645 = NX02 TaxID=1123269 RepID=W0AK64_9SPHN|nr:ABC transporter permease [Sphingomonas sanxanigenens]AHE56957.1 hypothetical protein NX02_26840 [Sphingomonas sanxanigenens DSM 19645 = NX02]
MSRLARQTLVIARRDFVATVFTPTFLIFLLAPLLMMGFSLVGGLGAAKLAQGSDDRVRIVALADERDGKALTDADTRLRAMFRFSEAPPPLAIRPPGAEPRRTAQALFADDTIEASAVLFGPLDRPTILHGRKGGRTAAYLAALAEQALRDRRAGMPGTLSTATIEPFRRTGSTDSGRQAAGLGAVMAMFLLTLLLAGQSVGMLAEEKSNKVIEILAAAVPLEAVFLGKLIGLFGVALLFIGFWATLLAQVAAFIPPELVSLSELQPAIGSLTFTLLFGLYFAMAYLLLGAVFLGIGAQAASMREIQMLSLPISVLQVAMFGLSAAAADSPPDSSLAIFAALFPFSSPFAMAGRAATEPEIWPHLLALTWQGLWVALVIWLAARWFRRGVLKSGGRRGFKGLFAKG